MKLNPAEKNAFEALEYVLHATKVKVTSPTIRERLYLHPDFPSIAALSDVLNEWKVPNVAARISVDQLKEAPLPAVAFLDLYGGYFAPLKAVSADGEVTWLDTRRGWQKENISTFAHKWSGVALLMEPVETSGERNYEQRRKESLLESLRTPFLIIGALALVGSLLFLFAENIMPATWNAKALLAVKLIGSIVTGLLLWHSIDADNPFLRKLCSMDNRSNCNSILNSEASRLWGWLGWSEIGFIYFAGGGLALGLIWVTGRYEALTALLLLNVWVLPYTFYSVYYQARKAKQWCRLCLVVQALLWVEFALAVPMWLHVVWGVSSHAMVLLLFSFLLPALLWVGIKKPLKDAVRVYPLIRELYKTKLDPGYVTSLFNKPPDMPPLFSEMKTVLLGNPQAKHSLTVVTNPLCGPCQRLHKEIKQLLSEADEINCRLVFIGPPEAQRIAEVLLSLSANEVEHATHAWYDNPVSDVKKWLEKWSSEEVLSEGRAQLPIHARWSQMARVNATPTVFLDGVTLPAVYSIKELGSVVPLLPARDIDFPIHLGSDQVT